MVLGHYLQVQLRSICQYIIRYTGKAPEGTDNRWGYYGYLCELNEKTETKSYPDRKNTDGIGPVHIFPKKRPRNWPRQIQGRDVWTSTWYGRKLTQYRLAPGLERGNLREDKTNTIAVLAHPEDHLVLIDADEATRRQAPNVSNYAKLGTHPHQYEDDEQRPSDRTCHDD